MNAISGTSPTGAPDLRYQHADAAELEFRAGLGTSAVRLVPTDQARLNAVRRDLCNEVLDLLSRPPRVATYVRDEPGLDTSYWHDALTELAAQQGWRVIQKQFTDRHDQDGVSQFDDACQHAAKGFIDGILVIRRYSLRLGDTDYEQRLRWLRERHAFIAVHRQLDTGCAR